MNKTFTDVGFVASNTFRLIGEGINFASIIKPIESGKILFESDTHAALAKDWEAVGKEVGVAIERFDEQHGSNRHLRTASRFYITTPR